MLQLRAPAPCRSRHRRSAARKRLEFQPPIAASETPLFRLLRDGEDASTLQQDPFRHTKRLELPGDLGPCGAS